MSLSARSAQVALCAALVLVAPPLSAASVLFENAGNTTGWSTIWHEDQGSVTQVSSPSYKGGQALRARTIYRAEYRGRYHSEVRRSGMANRGIDRYYGFALYLPANWQFVEQNYNFQQFIGNSSGCTGGQPGTMTHLMNRVLITRIVTGPSACERSAQSLTVTSNMTAGVWHRVVLRGKWESNNTGIFQFWYDGTQIINKVNLPTFPAEDYSLNLALGNYSNGWHDDGTFVGTQSTRDVFVDHVRVATSYSEADPAAWGGGSTPPSSTPTPAPTATPGGGSSGYYRIMARHSGKAISVQSASTANSANVIQWTYSSTTSNDEWSLVDLGNGYHRVVNRLSGKVLNVAGASTADGGNVDQWSWANVNQQQWLVADLGNGYHRFTARHSDKVLNVSGASTSDGANVDQWGWANVSQQMFQLVSVP